MLTRFPYLKMDDDKWSSTTISLFVWMACMGINFSSIYTCIVDGNGDKNMYKLKANRGSSEFQFVWSAVRFCKIKIEKVKKKLLHDNI